MLYWNANFQIPNSGVQSRDVYAVIDGSTVNFYADLELKNLLFTKEHNFVGVSNPYDYLLSLEDYSQYTKVN